MKKSKIIIILGITVLTISIGIAKSQRKEEAAEPVETAAGYVPPESENTVTPEVNLEDKIDRLGNNEVVDGRVTMGKGSKYATEIIEDEEISPNDKHAFVQILLEAAEAAEAETGIPASLLVSRAIDISEFGSSPMSKHYNYADIPWEEGNAENSVTITIIDADSKDNQKTYKKYSNVENFMLDYAFILSQHKDAKDIKKAQSPEEVVNILEKSDIFPINYANEYAHQMEMLGIPFRATQNAGKEAGRE